ncbi:pyridoxal phosphate-dependent aminotransferase [Neoaquamicrobium sediminum]|uniref:pyridoxal phosphate-dependent aminotransferase n=1 Tax=Neoaquamicrobium sediminum TaxID=1849104 RepID=UPI001564876A|nr:aminotransferase class I/II-fold pyridoxal phosphate-dependent enzyme [Mesorhizobium sediminum]NRC57347.1 histidinol-phosphate aminotransferase family protein [Mesorhizobium sediminum]
MKTSRLQGAKLVEVDVNPDGSLDIDAMLRKVTTKTKLLYVTSPHNPTGHILSEEHFVRLVNELPAHVVLYLDEAYFEFGMRAGAPDYLAIIRTRLQPWISTRTFSKAYGLAGARVGYGIASSAQLAAAYRAARPNFTTNVIGMAGAIAALDEPGFVSESLSVIEVERTRVGDALAQKGYRVLTTGANFVMAVMQPAEADTLARRLAEAGIVVRVIGMPRGEAGLRVTIGSTDDNDQLLLKLSQA